MSNLSESIKYIYPDINFRTDCILRDDGTGAYIYQWNYAQPQPMQAELDAAILPAAKAKKAAELKLACKSAIEAGFVSSALGSPHVYDSALPQDQINLVGVKQAGVDTPFTCTDSDGIKWQRLHTAAQIAQVYEDGMQHILSARSAFYAKLSLINAATDIAKVNAVSW